MEQNNSQEYKNSNTDILQAKIDEVAKKRDKDIKKNSVKPSKKKKPKKKSSKPITNMPKSKADEEIKKLLEGNDPTTEEYKNNEELEDLQFAPKKQLIKKYKEMAEEKDIEKPLTNNQLMKSKKGDIFDMIQEMLENRPTDEEQQEIQEYDPSIMGVPEHMVETFYKMHVCGSFLAETIASEKIIEKTGRDITGLHQDMLKPDVKKQMKPVLEDLIRDKPETAKAICTPMNNYLMLMGGLVINRTNENLNPNATPSTSSET